MLDLNAPWLMEPGRLAQMARWLHDRRADWPTDAQVQEQRQAAAQQMRAVTGKVAVLEIDGVIEHSSSMLSWFYGGFNCEDGTQALKALVANKAVEAIVLDIDSPGGSSYGVEEFADVVYQARSQKPIYAVANPMACSAAYWIATAAGNLSVCPSGDVGSVGVYMLHMDLSGALEEAGVKMTFIQAGKYKTDGNPYEPLSESAAADWQAVVDDTYAKFCKAVARNRNVSVQTVRNDFGQGRIMPADQALTAGMVDKVMTLDQVLTKLGGMPQEANGRRTSAEVLRLRHEQAKRRACCGRRGSDVERPCPKN